jgi:hypothetical protein
MPQADLCHGNSLRQQQKAKTAQQNLGEGVIWFLELPHYYIQMSSFQQQNHKGYKQENMFPLKENKNNGNFSEKFTWWRL